MSIDSPRYFGVNAVTHPTVPEIFHVGPYPADADVYWRYVAQQRLTVGIQLDISKYTYHAKHIGDVLTFAAVTVDGGPVRVTLQSVEDLPATEVKRRVYRVETYSDSATALEQSECTFEFLHLCMKWPDFGIPNAHDFRALMDSYLNCVLRSCEGSPGVLVHCRGGIGRSGTFVLARVLSASVHAKMEGSPEPDAAAGISRPEAVRILAHLRAQRYLVETDEQFAFAFDFATSYTISSTTTHKDGMSVAVHG